MKNYKILPYLYLFSGIGLYTFFVYSLTLLYSAPFNPQVIHGNAQFTTQGQATTIQVSDTAIIDYKGFNIGTAESVNFIQPSTSSRVLNRVVGNQSTSINGSLTANGIVYLVNPSGVFWFILQFGTFEHVNDKVLI